MYMFSKLIDKTIGQIFPNIVTKMRQFADCTTGNHGQLWFGKEQHGIQIGSKLPIYICHLQFVFVIFEGPDTAQQETGTALSGKING